MNRKSLDNNSASDLWPRGDAATSPSCVRACIVPRLCMRCPCSPEGNKHGHAPFKHPQEVSIPPRMIPQLFPSLIWLFPVPITACHLRANSCATLRSAALCASLDIKPASSFSRSWCIARLSLDPHRCSTSTDVGLNRILHPTFCAEDTGCFHVVEQSVVICFPARSLPSSRPSISWDITIQRRLVTRARNGFV